MTFFLLDLIKEGRSRRGPAPIDSIDLFRCLDGIDFTPYFPTITEATKHAIDVVCPPNVMFSLQAPKALVYP